MRVAFTDPVHYTLSDFAFHGLHGRRYVVFDVESTGADPAADSVTQIGAVAVYDDGPHDEECFVSLVKPWKPIPGKIGRLTGITNDRVAEAASFAAAWPGFAAFCGNSALVTQCGYEFDFPILDAECDRAGLPRLTNARLDTKAIFALLHPGSFEIFSTDFLSGHYGVDRSPFQRHDALGDALFISRFFHRQIQESFSLGLDHFATSAPLRIRRFVLPPI